MTLLTQVLAALMAAELLYIAYLEMVANTSEQTARVFGMDREELLRPSVQNLFKNQGAYNGVLGILLLVALFLLHDPTTTACLLSGVVAVAAYGGFTVGPSIFFKQGTLAVLALLSMLL